MKIRPANGPLNILARRLIDADVPTRLVQLPMTARPQQLLFAGATAADFTCCLERAQQL